MIRRTTGAFRVIDPPVQVNLEDVVYSAGVVGRLAQYTTGTSLVDRLAPIFPPTVDKVDLLSFSVAADLALWYADSTPGFGRFGKIVTGLTQVDGQTSSIDPASGTPVPWALGVELPADLALLTDLWNQENDPCPPKFQQSSAPGGGFTTLPVGATLTLPSPVPVFQGTDVFIGLWALPSLLSCSNQAGPFPSPSAALLLRRARYTFVYDDGS